MRIPANPHLAEPKVETLHELHHAGDAYLEPMSMQKIIGFHMEMVWYVSWDKNYTMLVGQIKNVAGKSVKKDCTFLIT